MQASDLLKALNRPANSDVLFICSTGDPGKIFSCFLFFSFCVCRFWTDFAPFYLFYLSHREFQNSDNGTTSNDTGRPIYAHAVLLMARSTYFEELLFPILGKRNNDNQEYGQEDPIEIEVPDSRSVMLEVRDIFRRHVGGTRVATFHYRQNTMKRLGARCMCPSMYFVSMYCMCE